MNATYKEFIENGAIIYPQKTDSLTAHSGNGRIELSWILSDPKVRQCRIYWNQRNDSLNVPIQKVKGIDTIRVMIDGLKDGIYTFEAYSYDQYGHISVGSEVVGTAYGEQYSNSLVNRFIKDVSVVNGVVTVRWTVPDNGMLGEEIHYADRHGEMQTIFVPVEDSAVLKKFRPGGSFSYRTLFLPDSLAIDTFYTAYQTRQVDDKLFQIELDKSLFEPEYLPNDTKPNNSTNTIDKIWDGKYGVEKPSFLTAPGSGFPQSFTFDLGATAQLSRMKLYQRGDGVIGNRIFNGGNIRKFKIYGCEYLDDTKGGWDQWTLLMECESKKPSGSPPGVVTQGDIDYALAGEEFVFPDTIPMVRYIRIETFENWDEKGRSYVNIGEMTFWATEVE